MKILLISGHGAGDSGAVGNGYQEYKLTREVTKNVKKYLSKYASVDIYNISRDAFQDVQNGQFSIGKYDYVLEVHFNSAGTSQAYGTEIYVTNEERGTSVENAIMKTMNKYFVLRGGNGVKRTNFAVINTVKNYYGISAALLEVCFISNKNDIQTYQKNKMNIAKDIAVAIAKQFGIYKEDKPKPATYYTSKKLKGVKIKKTCYLCKDYKLKKRYKKLNKGDVLKGVEAFIPKGWSKVTRLKYKGYYLTGNMEFVDSTHWLDRKYGKKVKVRILKECDYCTDKDLKKVKGKAKKGEIYTIVDNVVGDNGYTRLKTKSGYYITAHKSFTEWI